jgi:L-proline amide hydrolase
MTPGTKGTIPFRQWKTWYRITGRLDADRPPLIALHGGPGTTHDYLLALTDLAASGWPVIHYDQLGNGGSTHLSGQPNSFWNIELFLDELENLLQRLDLSQDYVLFGQSWGGMLAAEHAVRHPPGLRGLVIANTPASMPLFREGVSRLRMTLPIDVQSTLARHEKAGSTDSREYLDATMAFYERHVCRVKPLPKDVTATLIAVYNDPTVYHAMNGPSEFHVIGSLRDWTIVDRLPSVAVPTLLITGQHDEVTEAAARPFYDLIPDVRQAVFDSSSHMPHVEEPEKFNEVMTRFLTDLIA